MQTPVASYKTQWKVGDQLLVDSTLNDRYPENDLFSVRYPLPAHIGQGEFTSIKLASGISLHHSMFRFNVEASTNPVSVYLELKMKEESLLMSSVLSGGMVRHDHIKPIISRIEPGRTLLQWQEMSAAEVIFDRVPVIEILYLHASKSSLFRLIGQELTDDLQAQCRSPNRVYALPSNVIAPLKYCFDYRLDSSLQKLHAQNKALEFLEGLIGHLSRLKTPKQIGKSFDTQALFDYLSTNITEPHTVVGLAKLFGVSPKSMNMAFVRKYGMSVAQFIREQRLALAHEQITQSKLQISEIAAKLGYPHISNFSSLFKSFYGYSPITLRNQAMSARLASRFK
ncbi:helix-turn-helix domain-containing protein [Orrella daihaiensis]|uniref:AraC family transcriptional regulator n=1 Tax=Orrella daihaiensis TaxID=2782176 RepID=A0ABY4AMK1_9BURK|nr:helix-turn-helix domain-containing protein [Orrella daihaiensis]UOD50630.1 AraC family transcriptional regulator [Orrella daihaiensis]